MNIFNKFVDGTPDQRFKSWKKVFLGTCRRPSSDGCRMALTLAGTDFSTLIASSDGEVLVFWLATIDVRSYLVSGTKRTTATKLIPVKITAIHLCQRLQRGVTIRVSFPYFY
jgi:hypothetical protein